MFNLSHYPLTDISTNRDLLRLDPKPSSGLQPELLSSLLGWEFYSSQDDLLELRPSMSWIDQSGNENPVYTCDYVASPGDVDDTQFYDQLLDIEESIQGNNVKPMLLFNTCIFKKIKGFRYCIIGAWRNDLDWHWLFLSKEKPWQQEKAYPSTRIALMENLLDSPSELLKEPFTGSSRASYLYHCMVTDTITKPEFNTNSSSYANSPRIEVSNHWERYE
ncbi:hypothetical protein [Vibrio crassostreae]|uniref:hypothetical protein n=1 Tax=Vibrio crassostreae TaxID=246167 RepID=UPI001B30FAF9|nr:hypothetical protein [Vibrio crassostreae]